MSVCGDGGACLHPQRRQVHGNSTHTSAMPTSGTQDDMRARVTAVFDNGKCARPVNRFGYSALREKWRSAYGAMVNQLTKVVM